ncbi:MAG: tetratricopeptide repeat protein, partial [Parachlamydiaceae bacterium]
MSKEYSSFFEKLQEVLEEGGYEALESYVDTIYFEGLVSTERHVLGQLFVVRAEELLNQGDAKALVLLERAIRISQGDEKLLNRIGKIYASQTRNTGCLSAAIRVFETVLEIDSHNFEAIHGLIQIHLNRGIFLEDDRCFIEARTHCEAAHGHLVFHDDQTRALFYWNWGKVLFLIGKNGGEASEFHSAIEKYQYARSLNLADAEFLKDCGDAYFELGKLLSRESLCLKAIDNYREALGLSHDCADAWDSLGRCHALLFENFNDQQNFT